MNFFTSIDTEICEAAPAESYPPNLAAAMAAAARQAIMRPAHAILGSSLLGGHGRHGEKEQPSLQQELPEDRGEQHDLDPAAQRREQESIAQLHASDEVLPPDQIDQSPQAKDLGKSSSGMLRIEDFDLVKTLGTGRGLFPMHSPMMSGRVPSCRLLRAWLLEVL